MITADPLDIETQEEIVNKVTSDKVSGSIVFIVTNCPERKTQDISLDEILNNQNEYVVNKNYELF